MVDTKEQKENESLKINIRLTQLYLEMARSILTEVKLPEGESIEQIWESEGYDRSTGIFFTMASVIIIYSYLALEAFANYHLYQIWETARISHDAMREMREKDPTLKVTYEEFYKKYGKFNKFEALKKSDLKELSKRLDTICEAYKIPKIHEVNQKLWQDGFHELLKKARHFLVHPFPEPKEFQNILKTITNEELRYWIQVAIEVIKHFYLNTKKDVPEWLEKNVIFSITSIEYIS